MNIIAAWHVIHKDRKKSAFGEIHLWLQAVPRVGDHVNVKGFEDFEYIEFEVQKVIWEEDADPWISLKFVVAEFLSPVDTVSRMVEDATEAAELLDRDPVPA